MTQRCLVRKVNGHGRQKPIKSPPVAVHLENGSYLINVGRGGFVLGNFIKFFEPL